VRTAFAFEGRSRGGGISRQGVDFIAARCGTTIAALRRAASEER